MESEQPQADTDAPSLHRATPQSAGLPPDFDEWLAVPCLVLDARGYVGRANAAAIALLGEERSHVLGQVLSHYIAEVDRPLFAEHMRRCRRGAGPVTTELSLWARNGTAIPIELRSTPARFDEQSRCYPTTLVDCTRLKHAAEERRQLLREQEVIRAAGLQKDRFLAALSHELRTPLTPILALVSAMTEDASLSDTVRDDLRMIRRNVDLEVRLIDDLLDLTRIANGKVELRLETVNLHSLIHQTIDICADDIRAKRLQVVARTDALVFHARADAARVQQILWNLLRNAIKFTPASGRITFTTRNALRPAAPGEKPGELLVIEIADTGVGIDPQQMPRIFDAFEQGDHPRSGGGGGLGLGLAIAAGLVRALGGTLSAYSAGKGHGAIFTLQLPAVVPPPAEPQAVAAEASAASNAESRPVRVLLVEDHTDTARLLARLLGREGYITRVAAGVQSALDLASRERFDVIVSDLGLPDGNGLDLMNRLRQTCPIKGIAISGFGTDADIQRSQEAGFCKHLVKPLELAHLLKAIEEAGIVAG